MYIINEVEKLWKQVKAESAKPKSNKERIDQLKQEMTKRAKIFLKKYHKIAA